MTRRGSYIEEPQFNMTSFPSSPVHNAVRRMTELIDLENLEGYFDEYLLETQQQHQQTNTQDKEFDALPEETSTDTHVADLSSGPPSRFITIESYTKIFIERSEEEASKENKKRETQENKKVSPPKRPQRHSTTSRVTHLEKNAWKAQGTPNTVKHYDKNNKSGISKVFKFFCGVNDEFKWYSMKGKGVCIIIPMSVVYLILAVALLPFLVAAAVVSAFVLCVGICSYLSLATKKVGVSSDDDLDKSCFEALMWWA